MIIKFNLLSFSPKYPLSLSLCLVFFDRCKFTIKNISLYLTRRRTATQQKNNNAVFIKEIN